MYGLYSRGGGACTVLGWGKRCTPNDLFDWKPPKDTVIDDAHPLNSLKRVSKPKDLADMVSYIPLEKLEQIEGLLNQLRDG